MATQPSQDLARENEMLKQQLAQAQRLSALGELASTLTHEFNNILTTTMNYAKLGMRHKDEASRDKAFDKILSASQRAAKLTRSVLGMARSSGDAREAAQLETVVDDCLLLLERELNKYRVSILRDFQPVPPALVNPHQIQQVLMNLLINARQAMPQGGQIILRLRAAQNEPWVELSVIDQGKGIPADKLPHIFDPFYSTKDHPDASGKGGTGLGLSMCRQIIEAHQGRIRVESRVGKGTSFTLKLPVATEPKQRQAG